MLALHLNYQCRVCFKIYLVVVAAVDVYMVYIPPLCFTESYFLF